MASAIGSKVACLCFSVALLLPLSARGDQGTRAQTLFDEARSLMRDGNFAEACARLSESQRLEPRGGTLLNLALCWEKAGRLGRATQAYTAAEKQAIADGRDERRKFAHEQLGALRARVPKAIIVGPLSPKGAVRIDGELVPASELGEPLPLDPGQHAIQVAAPGYRAWSQKFAVFEHEITRVEIPRLQPIETPHSGEGSYEKRRYYKKQLSEGAIALITLGGVAITAGSVTGVVALVGSLPAYQSTARSDTAPLWGATGALMAGGLTMILVGVAIPKQEVEITPTLGGASVRVRW